MASERGAVGFRNDDRQSRGEAGRKVQLWFPLTVARSRLRQPAGAASEESNLLISKKRGHHRPGVATFLGLLELECCSRSR